MDPDTSQLQQDHGFSSLLQPPRWLRYLGTSSWYVAGIAIVTTAAVWLLAAIQSIALPVITACVVAAVASPLVAWLARHRLSRGVASALVLLAFIVVAIGIVLLITRGILSQKAQLSDELNAGRDRLQGWLHDLGVSSAEAQQAMTTTTDATKESVSTLLNGAVNAVKGLSSAVVFLSLTALSLFFLLKDGPLIRRWAERHAGVPSPIAHLTTGRVLQSLRGYFVGVTAVAVFNGVVVGLGALLLGVPLPGTIALVTFVGGYIPYLGAWSAGIFTVLVALGGVGTDAAIAMAIISLLANGVLQQLIQPIAYAAALGIHPLAVLIVTIAGGTLFGGVGLILAAPLTSAITRIATDLQQARQTGSIALEADEPAAVSA